eukprot:CAMPEP_0116119592 /NCGR_PEP_ID=MMETSP0329-20121206/2724_1 /TAXON_ID=697910 /ORGANISM="Pseudo-nitzschia arenysensis, Strain B593" /LENGTH=327 /DNA_ID=CAMNT_0003613305 /DNA_START=270 /DNA_END=1253 /DNA_ORIENTATION=+
MNSTSNRSADALRNLPPTTLGTIAICVLIHVIQSALGWNLQLFTMCPRLVLFTHEFYRVFTSAFFHANLMHIGMNMLSTAAISGSLEKRVGTLRLLVSIWWAVLLTSAIYMLIAYLAYAVFGYDAWMYQHAVGYSGIIFYLSVLESRIHPGPRSLFGFVSVPSSVYPWVLLVALQLFMPNLSFLGHLAGILNGTLEYYGALDVLYVSDAFLIHLESLSMLRKLVELDGFVATTTQGQRLRAESSPSAFGFFQPIRRILFAAKEKIALICGRNIQFSGFGGRATRRSGDDEIEYGVIRPPEFYNDRSLYANETMNDDEEREPLASQMV